MLAGKALASLHIAQVHLSLRYSTKSKCTDESAMADPEEVQQNFNSLASLCK